MPVIAIFTLHLLYHLAVILAWGGGLAFVASLAYLVYFYAVVLSSPAGDVTRRVLPVMMNIAMFAAFAFHHSLLARTGAKQWITRVVPLRFERTLYVWTASLLLFAVCWWWQPVAGEVYRADGWLRVPFWCVQLLGGYLVIRGAGVVSAFELAGIYQASRRASNADLKIAGPFRVVRHPIYCGWVLLVFATPAMTANRLLFASISTLYLILAIPWEEKSLVADHGDRYRDYQRQVRWRLLPGLW
jgi:protein-S-isoprenylcysteine O-methyltransferase Ste14